MEKIARFLIFLAGLTIFTTPLYSGWYGIGTEFMKSYHFYNPEFADHEKFHLVWKGLIFSSLGLWSMFGTIKYWNHSRLARRFFASIPFFISGAYMIAHEMLAPALGIANAVPHFPNYVLGLKPNVWSQLILFAVTCTGLLLEHLAHKQKT